jgi:Skp family chaperone for outer membrane proteins
VKIWLCIAGLVLASTAIADTKSTDGGVAVVNQSRIFQSLPQLAVVHEKLYKELSRHRIDIRNQYQDLQEKKEIFQRDSSVMSQKERKEMKEEIDSQQESLDSSVQYFENYSQQRQSEEESKLIAQMKVAISKVASNKGYNMVIDARVVPYFTKEKDITRDVLDQVK